ncbi:MAG: polyamine ABC transporter substrate-binding protein [Parvibaculum sp.]|uniref:polyamine ABC transporter substrate-binding protein n=1 Tax=Parvibaculum sp. TaxID=2024848 RepID=UPI003C74CF64
MIGKIGTGLVAMAVAGLISVAAHAEDKVLNIYNWSDYIAEDTVAKFEKQTGIKVRYDVYDGNETLEAKLMAGHSGYDIVVPTAFPFLDRQIKAGVYMKLDKSKIPNYKNLDPKLMARVAAADPGNEHAVIWMWGTDGVGYNVKAVEKVLPNAPVNSLDMIFKPEVVSKLAKCGVTMLDSPTDVIPVALNYLGLDPNSQNPEDLQKAQDLLMKIRPYIKYFNSSQYINDLANGDICVAFGWSGDVFQAANRAVEAKNGIEIKYSIPKEGTLIWFDTMAIPKDAPHPELAYQWINFVLQPEIEAANSNYVAYANPVPSSKPMVDEAVRDDPNIYPSEEVMDKLFAVPTKSEKFTRLQTRAWTSIRTGQ